MPVLHRAVDHRLHRLARFVRAGPLVADGMGALAGHVSVGFAGGSAF